MKTAGPPDRLLYQNNLPIAELLIRVGANVNQQDNTKQSAYLKSHTPMDFSNFSGFTLLAGADVHSTDSYKGTRLIPPPISASVEIIQELLKTDIKIDHINNLGWTALLEAIILGDGELRHTEVVRLLVEAGANVNLPDSHGITPLAHARQRSLRTIMEILSAVGAHE